MTSTPSHLAVRDQAVEQLTWHWEHQLRPGLEGLTDDEYFYEPVPDCWSVRRRGDQTTDVVCGSGDFVVEFAFPEPVPAPVTTIAWRLAHLIVGIFGSRAAAHFGAPPIDYATHDYAGTAAQALVQLDRVYSLWTHGVQELTEDRLWTPIGASEGEFAAMPFFALILHINREAIHHGAEILLLRDLHRRAVVDLAR